MRQCSSSKLLCVIVRDLKVIHTDLHFKGLTDDVELVGFVVEVTSVEEVISTDEEVMVELKELEVEVRVLLRSQIWPSG